MTAIPNPTRTRSFRSFCRVHRRDGPIALLFEDIHKSIDLTGSDGVNVPHRTRSRALAESTRVESVARPHSPRSLSFSEYSDHYERPGAVTRIAGSVIDAAPTILDWEIGG